MAFYSTSNFILLGRKRKNFYIKVMTFFFVDDKHKQIFSGKKSDVLCWGEAALVQGRMGSAR